MHSYGLPHIAEQRQDDQLELTYSSYVRIQECSPEDLPEAMNDKEKRHEMMMMMLIKHKWFFLIII